MAGRPSKPVQLIKLEGNKDRRTKKELAHREKMEKSLYTGTNFRESPSVKADPVAHKEFLRLRKLYKHIQYVDGLDEQIINRYCMFVSQEDSLQKLMAGMQESVDQCETVEDRIDLFKTINSTVTKLNQTRDAILKLEDRLFLNPTSRIRSIPKKPPEEKEESAMAKFMNRRGANDSS